MRRVTGELVSLGACLIAQRDRLEVRASCWCYRRRDGPAPGVLNDPYELAHLLPSVVRGQAYFAPDFGWRGAGPTVGCGKRGSGWRCGSVSGRGQMDSDPEDRRGDARQRQERERDGGDVGGFAKIRPREREGRPRAPGKPGGDGTERGSVLPGRFHAPLIRSLMLEMAATHRRRSACSSAITSSCGQ
jgi:hypothetical protein